MKKCSFDEKKRSKVTWNRRNPDCLKTRNLFIYAGAVSWVADINSQELGRPNRKVEQDFVRMIRTKTPGLCCG
jgi:hypothetical protein